ncbi:hypothetical protein [Rhodococcus sp. Leaf233]|uniref:hypothetical protein n=1 Tax=Rhodococcus sp. Leaf233 TaxID=1736302 RepID=UPI00070BA6BB|nr:hypothetical protein [Rhodococcus sp. Leaf233]KQU33551.1 hypothetical protein ASH04_06870 [Rhodococcus sp. Leaf233]
MPEVFNPAQVETAIRDCANRIGAGVTVCNTRYTAFLTADRAYDLAFAREYLKADGPAHERKYAAEVATTDLRGQRDVADAAYRFADRTAKAVESELRAMQSLGASIRQAYSVAGRGEGA